jgi:hypothetical protein
MICLPNMIRALATNSILEPRAKADEGAIDDYRLTGAK